MTEVFKAIIEQKKDALDRISEELEKALVFRDPPSDEVLRKCESSELVFLITLDAQLQLLGSLIVGMHNIVQSAEDGAQLTKQILQELGKVNDAKGGASFGW